MRFDLTPFQTIDQARAWAVESIDQAAGAARARYITVVPGQDATYSAKYADAQAFARAGYPEGQLSLYPWVQAEAEALMVAGQTAADEIMQQGDPWNQQLGPMIEKLRIAGKRPLNDLTDIRQIVAHVNDYVEQLKAV